MPFRKTRPTAVDSYLAEAAGLNWLAAAAGARVVDVVDVAADFIELEQLTMVASTVATATAFGAALATTHDAGAAAWGSPPDGYTGQNFIGRQPMTCDPSPSWGDFYAEQRVLPYLRRAVDRGHVDGEVRRMVERACAGIAAGDFDDPAEAPARIHGDLWSGNVCWTPQGAVLIDPAAHGGHRETDLAMLALFGAPHLPQVLAGYQTRHRLAEGWRDRVPLHQLHPLAVHAASHGSSYAAPLAAAARATLTL